MDKITEIRIEEVKDYENNIGWLHKSLIKGERYVLIVNKDKVIKNIHNRPISLHNKPFIPCQYQNHLIKKQMY